MIPKMYCPDCKSFVNVVEGVTAIHDRGYWWCCKHVKICRWENGFPIVDFPSPGKLQPRTLLQHDKEQ